MQNIHISEDELPVGIYKTTIEGKIIYANNTFLKLLGFTNISELEKINVNSLFVNPEIRQNQIDFWQENIIQSSEFELFTKDRKKITVIDNGYKTFAGDVYSPERYVVTYKLMKPENFISIILDKRLIISRIFS